MNYLDKILNVVLANIRFNRLDKEEQQVLIQQKYQPESGILINEQFTLQLGEQCHERFTKIKIRFWLLRIQLLTWKKKT